MQSEAGAAGTAHGALQGGALTTTFTASQGLLLMIPNMFKIAGELTPAVFHVAARTVATHALSIFGDHSDVMATRSTGWAMLASNSVQEAHDMAAIAQAATLESRIPFLHFFDGFRTSHEVNKIEELTDDDLRGLIPIDGVLAHRERRMDPDRPVLRGTAQNPDVFFQAREACNPFYDAVADIVQDAMDHFAEQIGRRYHLFDYVGAPDATDVIVMMGSGVGAAEEAVKALVDNGEKVGLVKVRLFRPFSTQALVAALPATVHNVAVLDRTKEPGAVGEPLFQDVTDLGRRGDPGRSNFVGGHAEDHRRTLRVVLEGVHSGDGCRDLRRGTQGRSEAPIHGRDCRRCDPICRSTPARASATGRQSQVRAVFYGLGADGTVGANKNTVKIIGDDTDLFAQGYFVYDSKKSGAMTTSHLRFDPAPIEATYLIDRCELRGLSPVRIHEQGRRPRQGI